MSDPKFTNPPAALRPPPKPTVEVETPPTWAIALGEKLDKLKGTVGANHEIVMHAIDGLRSRVGNLETWRSDSEERQRKHSGGIQKVSVNDASQDAAIAQLVTDVASVKATLGENTTATLAIKSALVDGVRGFFKRNPKLETALVALVMAALYAAGSWLTAHGGAK